MSLYALLHIEKVKIFALYSRDTSYSIQHPDVSLKEGVIAIEKPAC